MEFTGRKPIKGGINLVPLINIVFLLLIFFMLTSTLTTPDEFDIALPESVSGAAHGSEPIVILIGPDGAIAVNNRPVDIGEVVAALEAALGDGEAPTVMVKADARATTSDVVAVLRRAHAAGINRVALATQAAAP
jgi:biopolymer transport protein ExbD